MIDAELLEEVGKRIEDSWTESTPPAIGVKTWLHCGDFVLYCTKAGIVLPHYDCGERPGECFDLIARMEAAGYHPVFIYGPHTKKYEAWDYYSPIFLQIGETRTEAVLRLFVELMPVVNNG